MQMNSFALNDFSMTPVRANLGFLIGQAARPDRNALEDVLQ
jgi:hypothetical protein